MMIDVLQFTCKTQFWFMKQVLLRMKNKRFLIINSSNNWAGFCMQLLAAFIIIISIISVAVVVVV